MQAVRQQSLYEEGRKRTESSGTIAEMPESMRPREAFLRSGAKLLPEEALLAIILRTGSRGQNVADLARDILKHFGGLAGLSRCTYEDLARAGIPGLGRVKAMELASALELGCRMVALDAMKDADRIHEPGDVYALLGPLAAGQRQESFWVILLDTKNRVIERPREVAKGCLDSAQVHPREVFTRAVQVSAASVVLAHNHPSGDPTPSSEDCELTRRLVACARLLGLHVMDHVVLGRPCAGGPGFVSLRQRNLVTFC
jgi:DNA repair protein RadC